MNSIKSVTSAVLTMSVAVYAVMIGALMAPVTRMDQKIQARGEDPEDRGHCRAPVGVQDGDRLPRRGPVEHGRADRGGLVGQPPERVGAVGVDDGRLVLECVEDAGEAVEDPRARVLGRERCEAGRPVCMRHVRYPRMGT